MKLPKLPFPRTRLAKFLAVLGPGLITATAGMDAGGITTFSIVGAQYGYSLLWFLVIITVSLIVVQEMAARMGAVTGKGLADLIREEFGVKWTLLAMTTLFIANGGTLVAEFAGIAAAAELLGASRYVAVPVAAVALWLIVVRGSYRFVERVFLTFSLVLIGYIVAAFLANPDWESVVRQTLVPTISIEPAFILILITIAGTTVTPYMQMFVQSAVADKGIDVDDYGYERVDVISGSVFSSVIAFFIIVATGSTLFVAGISIDSAADAAQALAPIAGQYAFLLFAIGLGGASMLAASVLPLSTAYSIAQAFGWERSISASFEDAPAFNGLYVSLIGISAVLILLPGIPLILVIVLTQLINGILLPIILIFMLKLVNNRELMGEHVNNRAFNVVAWGTAVMLIALDIGVVAILLLTPFLGFQL